MLELGSYISGLLGAVLSFVTALLLIRAALERLGVEPTSRRIVTIAVTMLAAITFLFVVGGINH